MNITNEQIIQSARRKRQSVDKHIGVESWHPHRVHGHGLATIIAIAASFISFIAGYGLRANLYQHDAFPIAQKIQIKHDTIMQMSTIRDTIYKTRIVTRFAPPQITQSTSQHKQMTLASSEPQEFSTPTSTHIVSTEPSACSLLCDNIPYELVAIPAELK